MKRLAPLKIKIGGVYWTNGRYWLDGKGKYVVVKLITGDRCAVIREGDGKKFMFGLNNLSNSKFRSK